MTVSIATSNKWITKASSPSLFIFTYQSVLLIRSKQRLLRIRWWRGCFDTKINGDVIFTRSLEGQPWHCRISHSTDTHRLVTAVAKWLTLITEPNSNHFTIVIQLMSQLGYSCAWIVKRLSKICRLKSRIPLNGLEKRGNSGILLSYWKIQTNILFKYF